MISNLNYVHILVAALAYFVIGSLWYSLLFGKVWMQLVGVTPTEEDKKRIPLVFGTTFVLNCIISFGTACVLYFIPPATLFDAVKVGGMLGVCFVFTTTLMNNMYAKRPLKLTVIDSGYHIVAIIVTSIILTLWK